MDIELLDYLIENDVRSIEDFEELFLQNMMCNCEDERLGINEDNQAIKDWEELRKYIMEITNQNSFNLKEVKNEIQSNKRI